MLLCNITWDETIWVFFTAAVIIYHYVYTKAMRGTVVTEELQLMPIDLQIIDFILRC